MSRPTLEVADIVRRTGNSFWERQQSHLAWPHRKVLDAIVRCRTAAQRITLSSKLEQLEYEAKKAFEQYDAVDARNRLVAGELERRWNEKLEEVETTKQRLSSLDGKRRSLSSDEEERIRLMGESFAESWHSDDCPPALKKMIFAR